MKDFLGELLSQKPLQRKIHKQWGQHSPAGPRSSHRSPSALLQAGSQRGRSGFGEAAPRQGPGSSAENLWLALAARVGGRSNPPRTCSRHLGESLKQQQNGILRQSGVRPFIDPRFNSQLSSTSGPLTSFAEGRRLLPAPGVARQVLMAGRRAHATGLVPCGTAGAGRGGPLSLEGKGNSFAVMWNLSPALEMGRVGRRHGQGVPGRGWLKLCAGKNPTLSFTSTDNLLSAGVGTERFSFAKAGGEYERSFTER